MTQPFYNTGTATITNGSTAVVGVGTVWNGNIRPYDRLVGQDGREAIVLSVEDNTHLTLLRPWAGTSQVSAAYEIWMSPDEIFLQTTTRQILEAIASNPPFGGGEQGQLLGFDNGVPAWVDAIGFAQGEEVPTISLQTPGTSSFAYTEQVLKWTRIGPLVFCRLSLQFTPTIGTGSSNILVNGFPFTATTPMAGNGGLEGLGGQWVIPAGTTPLGLKMRTGGVKQAFIGAYNGTALINFAVANLTGGANHVLRTSIIYETSDP